MIKSYSKIQLPPFGVFAKLEFPPCTTAEKPTYATVQMGRNEHLNLNSDLLYINHGCDPSLVGSGIFFYSDAGARLGTGNMGGIEKW
jgi:hypothetical protein